MTKNSTAGKVFYGMHFCPGVARYPEKDNLMIFINESTIRDMNPTFSAKPVFVEHVDGVDDDLDEVRTEADGWVVESFYNEADGKTWAKFIIVSDRGIKAIAKGYRLSNAYEVSKKGASGVWNGVPYQEEVLAGEFEHLALVKSPRYEESVILTPAQFKEYNEEQKENLKRFANSKGRKQMAFSLFKRQKVETGIDPEETLVEIGKSGKVVPLSKIINSYEKIVNLHGFADQDHMVKLHDGSECSVGELLKKHKKAMNDIDALKKAKDDERVEDDFEEDFDEVGDRGGDKGLDDEDDELPSRNSEDEDEDRREDEDASDEGKFEDEDEDRHEDESDDEDDGDEDDEDDEENERKNKKRKNKKHHNSRLSKDARRRIARIKNAREGARARMFNKNSGMAPIHLTMDAVARGRAEYGSKK